ncbi:hypothetical protein [Corynebacterium halotolerans]|uniref:Uncharacterized protein n=1 Tax=Corynebacterium halotolerans YIM 70093 = DSM 44683 TaxID=1121362 RepID=M1NPN3_9CORY|nr:hypothetical protein [Corynebacterium halotolerans]AGF71462.1 hypothetical protein A605_02240 [Corynebacterium halotolerans YIM 70093 = DSM 44683]
MADTIITGGGSGTATWAAHSHCGRFRGTDPVITGTTRRALAAELGHPDVSSGIPQARWTRALTFERVCHDEAFAGELVARATGWAGEGFAEPEAVATADCRGSVDTTARQLEAAVERAAQGEATLLYQPAVPFPGVPGGADATGVHPDLVVVAARGTGAALIVGDVKDYERIRSRIDDARLMKGFLQVAMGALAFDRWDGLPTGLTVSRHGFLAVPRSVFLQPAVEVEDLRDYLTEVQLQIDSRRAAAEDAEGAGAGSARQLVEHLHGAFDPDTCPSCSLFNYCRQELQVAADPEALLVEIGVPETERASVAPVLRGDQPPAGAKASTVKRLRATLDGRVANSDQRRLDPLGAAGTVSVVAVKSDAAALGYHGLGVRRHTADGPTPWEFRVFTEPQNDATRRKVMAMIGHELELAMAERARAGADPDPVHVVVPDQATSDLLASTADLLAGVELSRLRWRRDEEMGREALTYNGDPAVMPRELDPQARTAVSFLLEQDRARMLQTRQPVVDATRVLNRHFIPGGAAMLARRLDYVVRWALAEEVLDHRQVAREIEGSVHTPGARLSNQASDELHAALDRRRTDGTAPEYTSLVEAELRYRAKTLDQAVRALERVGVSRFAAAVRSFEGDAQAVWRRRRDFRASDLVRFGRTHPYWRNRLVDVIQSDTTCTAQVDILTSPLQAQDAANDAGNRQVTSAEVTGLEPLTLRVASRRFTDGTGVVMVSRNGAAWVEGDTAEIELMKGAVKLKNFPQGGLSAVGDAASSRVFVWSPATDPQLAVGDRLVLVNLDFFDAKKKWFNIPRPARDELGAPKPDCEPESYAGNPEEHQWCCRPHEVAEAEFADELALRRGRNELNPQAWPPLRDADGFEVAPADKPTAATVTVTVTPAPEGLTVDELE